MNRIDKKLQEIKQKKKIGLMTHVVVGYPSLEETIRLIELMETSGVDMIELQIPFSDPLADGPTIMKACEESLANGTRVGDAFDVVEKVRKKGRIPLLFMCYYNTVFQYGIEKFCRDAAMVGIDGLIVPDMPIDEENEERFYFFAKKYGLHTIQVVSPASTEERLKKISKVGSGFVYATARQGITGAKNTLDSHIEKYVERIKKNFDVPIAVGFGISRKEHVASLVGKANVAVVGSKIIDIMNTSKNYEKEVADFIKELNVVE